MASQGPAYSTRELFQKTWPDFERLFSHGNGWDFCWCMHFHQPRGLPRSQWLRTRAERGVRNRREKRELVARRRSRAILLYANVEPVGWCQYAPRTELPRIDNSRKYRELAPEGSTKRPWRITCFAVLKKYRKRGKGTAALKAALEAIRIKGGGLVEAYPITSWESRAFGNESTHGTASMFKNAGFKAAAPLGSPRFSTHVCMRRSV